MKDSGKGGSLKEKMCFLPPIPTLDTGRVGALFCLASHFITTTIPQS